MLFYKATNLHNNLRFLCKFHKKTSSFMCILNENREKVHVKLGVLTSEQNRLRDLLVNRFYANLLLLFYDSTMQDASLLFLRFTISFSVLNFYCYFFLCHRCLRKGQLLPFRVYNSGLYAIFRDGHVSHKKTALKRMSRNEHIQIFIFITSIYFPTSHICKYII